MEQRYPHLPIDPFGLEGPVQRPLYEALRRRRPKPRAAASFARSLLHARDGLLHAFATQRNFRIQCAFGLAALLAAVWLRLAAHHVVLVAALAAMVLCAELVNTAIEATLDECVGVAFDPAVKRIKDMAAAAVAIVCVGAAVLGASVFLPPLLQRISR